MIKAPVSFTSLYQTKAGKYIMSMQYESYVVQLPWIYLFVSVKDKPGFGHFFFFFFSQFIENVSDKFSKQDAPTIISNTTKQYNLSNNFALTGNRDHKINNISLWLWSQNFY